ncbi:MAG: PLP-dependent transferase, partial [Candidatus Cryptobacteroides sp.]
MKTRTKTIHSAYQSKDAYGALAMPVYHTAAYEFENAEIMADAFCSRVPLPDYSRVTNPTVIYFEKKVKEITGAEKVYALSSGMAAISNALLALCESGKNIVTSKHLFGNTWMLLSRTFARYGIEARFCDLCDPTAVKDATDDDTVCIYTEIISNPLQEVVDLRMLADIAHSQGKLLVADTTMIPFTRFSAKDLGVDLEIVSGTKYVSGGASTVGGLVIDYSCGGEFRDRMQELLLNLGAYMTPHVAYMQTIGLENLE